MKKIKKKISIHISHYVSKNSQKIYLKKIFKNFSKFDTDNYFFIHSNVNLKSKNLKKIKYIFHNLKNGDPRYLTWKSRKLMEKQKNNFDYFIYMEDDINFTKKNFQYWLKNSKDCIKNDFNLGFFRFEKDRKGLLWSSDLSFKLSKYVLLNKKKYIVNDVNPYCAFWIYNKFEFNKFIKSNIWKFKWKKKSAFAFYNIQEMSAVGWHGLNMERYLATIIPIKSGLPSNGSMVHHMSNVHVKKNVLSYKVKINDLILKTLEKYEHPSSINRMKKKIKYILLNPFRKYLFN